MPSQTPLYNDQYYQQYPYAAPRYHQASYSSAPSQPSVSLLGSAGDTLTSYGTRQSWSADSQHTGSEYDSPSGTPYSEYGPSSEQEYYSGSTGSTVGYPESSQRTHVSGGAFPALYSPRYYGATESLNNVASRLSDSSEDEQATFRYADSSHDYSPHHSSSPLPTEATRRADRGSWQAASGSPPAFDRLPSQLAASYARNDASTQLGGQSSVPYILTRSPPATISPHHEPRSEFPSRPVTRDSPKVSAYAYQSRLPNASRLGEPGNPSVVPPLVFDGEEYDDESECSLPSATSDVFRSVYHNVQSPAQYSSSNSESGLSYSASVSHHSRNDTRSMHSSTPPPDSASSSPRLTERPVSERSKSAHKKSKMHQCTVCTKWFPRPSGLATHMNSHSGAKREHDFYKPHSVMAKAAEL